jgi:hypothetical protein
MCLGVVDGRVRHVAITVDLGLRARLGHHVGPHSPRIIPGSRPGSHLRLGRVASLRGSIARVVGHTVRHRRRCGRGLFPNVRKRRRALELGWQHVRVHGVPLRLGGILSAVVVVAAAAEVCRTLVLVGRAVLYPRKGDVLGQAVSVCGGGHEEVL